ncbi:MAG TPA: DNA-3-methyladenine glycosylase I [Bacteroidota bacterium]|nr:DNA-3-methyladenine glycosylase I [Bacteroidota bacterium]
MRETNKQVQTRCPWGEHDPLYRSYHDREWGVPVHNERRLFEMLCLEGAQAGLSWITILRKRGEYRKAFDNFDPGKIAAYDRKRIIQLLGNSGIVRNRLKIEACIRNARAALDLREEGTTLDAFLWQFVDGKPIVNRRKSMKDVPASTNESEAMSKALKSRGFNFVGSTICYAYMQACGMVNDHLISCFRYKELR